MCDRPTYARAVAGYDQEFRERLAKAIMSTIAHENMVADANVMAIRTSETADALTDILCTVLTIVPAMSIPSKLRETAERLAKRIRRDVGKARADGVADMLSASQWSGTA